MLGRSFFLFSHVNHFSFFDLTKTFFIGFRLDSVINSAVLLFVILLLFISNVFNKMFYLRAGLIAVSFFYALAFYLVMADIVFYSHYKTHISISALHWIDSPLFMIKMIFGEIKNILYFLVYLLIAFVLFWIIKRMSNSYSNSFKQNHYRYIILVLLIPFLIFGIRGRLASKSTINWGVAMFSTNQNLNMAAINPVYYFVKSFGWNNAAKNKIIESIPYPYALQLVKNNITTPFQYTNKNSIYREVTPNGEEKKYNIVLVISESLGTSKMNASHTLHALTPFTDSLALSSTYFSNFYADGIHTFNGLYSSLTGMPSLPLEHSLKQYATYLSGIKLPQLLNEKGYHTTFYSTHDKLFDNQYGFAKLIGFEKVISQENFPTSEVIGATGVPDHALFNKAIKDFDTTQKHFFACILTGTDHPPYDIPNIPNFIPAFSQPFENAANYADWALRNFIYQSQSKPWFDNTIFIITGDHGSIIHTESDMYLSKLSVPLIIYAPAILKQSQPRTSLAGQIDIPPTILGLLQIPYTNTSFGIDVFREKRNFISSTYDETMLAFDTLNFYVYRKLDPAIFMKNKNMKYCKRLQCISKTCLPLKLFPLCTAKATDELRNFRTNSP